MPPGGLHNLRVLDLSLDVGGLYCAKLLADLGADVILCEPPGGHPLRREGPFPGPDDPEKGGLFRYLCANQRGLTLDLRAEPPGLSLAAATRCP